MSRFGYLIGVAIIACPLTFSSASAASVYWNLFNEEGESGEAANFATYSTRSDMLNDANRTGTFIPNGSGTVAAANLIESGSNGSTYWNLFNEEGESGEAANFATYATLSDMLNDTNRTGVFIPVGTSTVGAANLVGTGAATVEESSATPLPGAFPLFTSGLAALSLLGWRRKRKSAVLAAVK